MVKKNDPALLAALAYAEDLRARVKAEWDAVDPYPAREHTRQHRAASTINMLTEQGLKKWNSQTGRHISQGQLLGLWQGILAFAVEDEKATMLAQYARDMRLVLALPGRFNDDELQLMTELAERLGAGPVPAIID